MKTLFYYHRDENNRPIKTFCLLNEPDLTVRGQAVCSEKDHPNKKVGRSIAHGRALKAWHSGKNDYDSNKKFYKAEIQPELTPYEKKLLSYN